MKQMQWQTLLTFKRLGLTKKNDSTSHRTTFQKDFDRLVFSAAFRRMQDKTQVFPLAQSDYVRTRLTHSLEVSSVCRSIGTMVGEHLVKHHELQDYSPFDIGAILAAAALAHDIGNPPFGHAGEEAIGRFFREHSVGQRAIAELTEAQRQDFLTFEGNAQGFRLLTKLQNADNTGGLQLSLPTIASFVKYPCPSINAGAEGHIAFKKFNYFQAEKQEFLHFATDIGLLPHSSLKNCWYRHPFAYLLEAADDICYCLVDLEDAYRLALISSEEILAFYTKIVLLNGPMPNKFYKLSREKDQIEYLRAFTVGLLVDEVVTCFISNEQAILGGTCHKELLAMIPSAQVLKEIKAFAFKHIFVSKPVLEVGIAGFEVLDTLLKAFVGAVNDEAYGRSSSRSRMLIGFLPDQFLASGRIVDDNPYLRLLKITDFISGMTDRYAVNVYKTISGAYLST